MKQNIVLIILFFLISLMIDSNTALSYARQSGYDDANSVMDKRYDMKNRDEVIANEYYERGLYYYGHRDYDMALNCFKESLVYHPCQAKVKAKIRSTEEKLGLEGSAAEYTQGPGDRAGASTRYSRSGDSGYQKRPRRAYSVSRYRQDQTGFEDDDSIIAQRLREQGKEDAVDATLRRLSLAKKKLEEAPVVDEEEWRRIEEFVKGEEPVVRTEIAQAPPASSAIDEAEPAAPGSNESQYQGKKNTAAPEPETDPGSHPRAQEGEREVAYIEVDKPGFERFYAAEPGFKITNWLKIGAYTEITADPNPVESYVLDAKALKATLPGGWNSTQQFRDQVTPIFSRVIGVQPILKIQGLPLIKYTWDYREILHQYEKRWEPFNATVKDIEQTTHEILLEYAKDIAPLGHVVLNPGYKRIYFESEEDPNSYQKRNEYFVNVAIKPSDFFEVFGQLDYYSGKTTRTPWISKPEQLLGRMELRQMSPAYKMSVITGYSHSLLKFKPDHNNFRKQEMFVDVGKDFTDKLKGSTRLELILAKNKEPDTWIPFEADADVINSKSKLGYTLFPNFDIRGGFEHSHALDYNYFDNFSFLTEGEYYKIGWIRALLGLKYTRYYNINDDLFCAYLKCLFNI